MAQVINTSGSISTFLSSIYEAALLTARENSVMARLVTVYGDQQGMAGRVFSTYTNNTMSTIAETVDMGTSSSVFTPTKSGTLTPYVYAMTYILGDMRVASDPFAVVGDAGRDLGQAYAVAVDSALCGTALFCNLTAGTVGTAGTLITWPNILKASAYVKAQKVAGPYSAVLAPAQWYDLASATSVPSLLQSQRLMDEFGQFYVASWAGINFFVDANIANTAGTTYGALFNPQALALDIRRGYRVEGQRDASIGGGATELNASAVFAYGLYRAAFGCTLVGASY